MPKNLNHSHGGDCCNRPATTESRRGFLTLAALSAGVALLTPALPRPAGAAAGTDILLLSCMDYRLMDEVAEYMQGRGLKDKYDHVILAGAGLGAVTDAKPDWGRAFWEHVDVAKSLHHIKKIIVLDHRDCGAYKVFLNVDLAADPAKETEVHTQQLHLVAAQIKARHPDLEIELLLMALDGTVMAIPAA